VIHLLAEIDWRASAGRTPWHRASAIAKLALALVVLGVAVLAPDPRVLLVAHVTAWLLVVTSGLPWRLVLSAASYPILFSALFVVARWDGTWLTPLVLLARPLTAGLLATWLVGTTPYPDLFAPIARVLPRPAGDSLFLTYRALFALLQRADRLWRALRLRGGFTGPMRRRLAHTGEGLGVLVIHSFERSRRIYETMHLRGHSGRVCGCRHWTEVTAADGLVLALAIAFAGACFAAPRWIR
jgi:cobalt/nickel transport system permease protein